MCNDIGLKKYTEEERPPGTFCKCYDCNLPYEDFPCDVVVPHDFWEVISPSTCRGGGLLCPNCLLRRMRLVNTDQAKRLYEIITHGAFNSENEPTLDVEAVASPEVVCLCGSTRFMDAYNDARKRLTYEDKIVLSVEIVTTQSRDEDPQHVDPQRKVMLDELHLRKIDLADRVLVLNVGGYIGESTRNEINYAENVGKPIDYLEALTAAIEQGKK